MLSLQTEFLIDPIKTKGNMAWSCWEIQLGSYALPSLFFLDSWQTRLSSVPSLVLAGFAQLSLPLLFSVGVRASQWFHGDQPTDDSIVFNELRHQTKKVFRLLTKNTSTYSIYNTLLSKVNVTFILCRVVQIHTIEEIYKSCRDPSILTLFYMLISCGTFWKWIFISSILLERRREEDYDEEVEDDLQDEVRFLVILVFNGQQFFYCLILEELLTL